MMVACGSGSAQPRAIWRAGLVGVWSLALTAVPVGGVASSECSIISQHARPPPVVQGVDRSRRQRLGFPAAGDGAVCWELHESLRYNRLLTTERVAESRLRFLESGSQAGFEAA